MGSHSRSEDRESSSRSKHSRSSRGDERDDAASSSKRHRRSHADEDRHRDKDTERKSSSSHHHRSHKHSSSSSSRKKDDVSSSRRKKDAAHDANEDDDEWVEKDSAPASATAAQAPVDTVGTFSIGSMPTSTAGLRRLEPQDMTDGYGQGDVGGSNERGGGLFGLPGGGATTDEADFFGSFGTERRRKEPKEKVDPAVSPRHRERD